MERTISNIKSKVLFLLLALSQGAWATDISIQSFINSFSGYLNGVKDEFK